MMLPSTRRLLLGAVLLTGQRSASAFQIAPTVSRARPTSRRAATNAAIDGGILRHARGGVRMSSTATPMQDIIESRLRETLTPAHLEVINESHMHSGPATESHFKVIVVTEQFEGKPLLARHRMVNSLFAGEMGGPKPRMHALSIQGKTPAQWEAEGHKVAPSPPCMGGSKADPSMPNSVLSPALRVAKSQQEEKQTRRWRARLRDSARPWLRTVWSRRSLGVLALVFLTCSVGMLFAESAKATAASAGAAATQAAGKGGNVGTRVAELLDDTFIQTVEKVGKILDTNSDMHPLIQARAIFLTAWVSASVGSVAAAGVLGQPLGRTMVLTALSHTIFSVYKLVLALMATSKHSRNPTPKERQQNQFAMPKAKVPSRRFSTTRRKFPRPFLKRNTQRRNAAVKPAAISAGRLQTTKGVDDPTGRNNTVTIAEAHKVPKWLIVVAAIFGPAVATVSGVVAYHFGGAVPITTMSALAQGSVLGTLLAGTLSWSGAGTDAVARWATLQYVGGLLFQLLLSDGVLMTVFFVNTLTPNRPGKLPPGPRGEGRTSKK